MIRESDALWDAGEAGELAGEAGDSGSERVAAAPASVLPVVFWTCSVLVKPRRRGLLSAPRDRFSERGSQEAFCVVRRA